MTKILYFHGFYITISSIDFLYPVLQIDLKFHTFARTRYDSVSNLFISSIGHDTVASIYPCLPLRLNTLLDKKSH